MVVPSPRLLIAQPSVADPSLFDLGLGIQNLWANALGELGVDARPSLYWCDDPDGRRRPTYSMAPYRVHSEAAEIRALEGVRMTHSLQSHLEALGEGVLIHARLCRCRFTARFTSSATRDRLWALEGGGDERAMLETVDEVVRATLSSLEPADRGRDAAEVRAWREHLRTCDPADAAARLLVRAGHVRERHGLGRRPVLDRVAAEWEPRRRFRAG